MLFTTAAQDSAILALEKIGAPSIPYVVAHLEDPAMRHDIVFRQQMVGALDQIAAPPGVPELIKIAGLTDQPSVQRLAQVALADTVLASYTLVQTDKDALAAAKTRREIDGSDCAPESHGCAAVGPERGDHPSWDLA